MRCWRPSRRSGTPSSTAMSSNASSMAHADVLDAVDKADGRFAGGRAQRRVEATRRAEQALLDELGFASYSDYMMGYSLLNVDPEKEAALEAARAELSARGGRVARPPGRDRGRAGPGRADGAPPAARRRGRARCSAVPWPPGAAVEELRATAGAGHACRPSWSTSCSAASTTPASRSRGEDLSRDELMLLAEAWLDEADDATAREQELRRELAALARRAARGARGGRGGGGPRRRGRRPVAGGGAPGSPGRDPRAAATPPRIAHQRPPSRRRPLVAAVAAELADAVEAERLAAEAAADAEAAVAEADRAGRAARRPTSCGSTRSCRRSTQTEVEANEHLQSLSDHEYASPEELARELARGRGGLRGRRRPPPRRRRRRCETLVAERIRGAARCVDVASGRAPSRSTSARSPRRSSGTCSPGWPPSGPCASADRCRCCSTMPSTASTRTSSATSSGASSGWPTRCR